MNKNSAGLAVLIVCICAACSSPKPSGSGLTIMGETGSGPAPAAGEPRTWVEAQKVVDATAADVRKNSFQGVAPHVQQLEAILASANTAYNAATPPGGPVYKLVDGTGESLEALLTAAIAKTSPPGGKVIAVQSPYVSASFFLGAYYNEIGRPTDALRVLDAGLALPKLDPDLAAGSHSPIMLAERGAAFVLLKRWPDALASYEKGLALSGVDPRDRGKLLRGKGFALTELGRLDEAENTYRESLSADPANRIALSELNYIAGLKAGKPKTAVETFAPDAPKPNK